MTSATHMATAEDASFIRKFLIILDAGHFSINTEYALGLITIKATYDVSGDNEKLQIYEPPNQQKREVFAYH